jgi:o-succinylbenzoate---CoA ligase
MVSLLDELNKYCDRHCLVGCDRRELVQLAEQFYLEIIAESSQNKSLKIILAESNPLRFLAGFIAACSANCSLFLCNPYWGEREWQQVFEIVQPDIIIQNSEFKIQNLSTSDANSSGFIRHVGGQINNSSEPALTIMIPTGGSSGKIRFAIHTWDTLTASVRGFQQYFQVSQINSFCVLPLYHVSGLMQFIRSLISEGELAIIPFKSVESGVLPDINPAEFFISLVPTQLQRLLQTPNLIDWLAQFQTVLLGGAPAWQELLNQARNYKIRLAPTYGMTETASQIATLKPEDFLKGNNNCGRVLPHAQVKIVDANNRVLNKNRIGFISIQARSLTLGYYPELIAASQEIFPCPPDRDRLGRAEGQKELELDDLGFFDDRGYLNIVGRNSQKIITGGENVYPCEVEAAIRATQLVDDIAVIGLFDRTWGEIVVAIYVPKYQSVSPVAIKTAIADSLSKFKIPKYWISAQKLPRNAQGKLNREQLHAIAILSQESGDRQLETARHPQIPLINT